MGMSTLSHIRNLLRTWPEDRLAGVEVFGWRTALSNMDWTDHAYGHAIHAPSVHNDGRCVWLLLDTAQLVRRDTSHTVWVIDDGHTVTPCYGQIQFTSLDTQIVGPYALVHPYPVNPNGDRRPDNGRVIDYSTWHLGPARSWHIKIWSGALDWRDGTQG